MRRCGLLVASVLVLAASQSTYTINWTEVPATAPVISTYQALTNAGTVSSLCPCDLILNQCDWNCGCDGDCSATESAMFAFQNDYANTTDRAYKCISKDAKDLMPFYTARGDLEFEELSDGGLCIVYEYDDGAYYQTPWTNVTDAQWQRLFDSDSRVPKVYNFTAAQTDQAGWYNRDYTGTLRLNIGVWIDYTYRYTYGDPVMGYRGTMNTNTSDTSPSPYAEYFVAPVYLPARGYSGECVDKSEIRWLMGTTSEGPFQPRSDTCIRRATNLEASCVNDTVFDANRYLPSDLRINSAYVMTSTSLELTNANSSLSWPPPTPTWDGATGICSNAFAGVIFNFTVVDGIITDLSVSPLLTNYSATHMDGSIEVTQTFVSIFTQRAQTYPAVERSGNGGYLSSLPVLSGLVAVDSSSGLSAIQQTVGGLVVPSTSFHASSAQACLDVAEANSSIRFDSPSSSCCARYLSLAELETECNASHVPDYPIASGTYLGILGSADYYRLADWLLLPDPVEPSTSYNTPRDESAPYWDPITGTCFGILGGSMRIEFDWVYQGAFAQPHARIAAARQVWERQTWRYMNSEGDGTQKFTVCTQSAWSQLHTEMSEMQFDRNIVYPIFVTFWGADQVVDFLVFVFCFAIIWWIMVSCTF